MATATTYVLSRDRRSQIVIEASEEVSALTWGHLITGTRPIAGVAIVSPADPMAWVKEQHAACRISTADRLACLRAKWAALAPKAQERRAA